MKPKTVIAIGLPCLLVMSVFSAAQAQQPRENKPAAKSADAASSEGEKRFLRNCGRCHNPPEDISPREARAVVRQMRVRAMLSAEDERLILEFLAP
jgi:cytochrome c5